MGTMFPLLTGLAGEIVTLAGIVFAVWGACSVVKIVWDSVMEEL